MKSLFAPGSIKLLIILVFAGGLFSGCKSKGDKPGTVGEEIIPAPNPTFMTISDVHLDPAAADVDYGCDTGVPLWESALKKYAEIISTEHPGFILCLGDLPAHAYQGSGCTPASLSPGQIHTAIGDVLGGLRHVADSLKVPLLYLPGNNDGYGGDYSSFTDIVNGDSITPFKLDTVAAKEWPVINPAGSRKAQYIDGNKVLGYYAAYPLGAPAVGQKPLRVLMLNTVIFCSSGYISDDNQSQQQAATLMLDWFSNQLNQTAGKERVIVAMHIPPGYGGYYKKLTDPASPNWNPSLMYGKTNPHTVEEEFYQQIEAHSGDIVAVLTSHTHTDDFKRIFDGKGNLVALTLSTPGITVDHENNPGMKVFEYAPADYSLTDSRTYYCVKNASGVFADWSNAPYSFCNVYGYKNAVSLMDCVKKMGAAGSSGFQNQSFIVSQMKQVMMVKSPNAENYRDCALDIGGGGACK